MNFDGFPLQQLEHFLPTFFEQCVQDSELTVHILSENYSEHYLYMHTIESMGW